MAKPRKIRIIGVPPGEAPEEVRQAWVGLVLPTWSGRKISRGSGVLTGPKTVWRLLFTRGTKQEGYGVLALKAFEVLLDQRPEAWRWWKENTPHLFRPGMGLFFAAEVCEEIAE